MLTPTVAEPVEVLSEKLTPVEVCDRQRLLEMGLSAESTGKVADCAAWTMTYPLKRVKKHRRVEAICPMVAPSLAADGMRYSVASVGGREPALDRLDGLLIEAADSFDQIETDDERLRCLVVVVPEVKGSRLLEATRPDRDIKNRLLQRGILVGEFFPSCPFATTFNPRLFALRSPAPMYVLRTFLESDWRFVCQIPQWQKTYRERFGDPPRKLKHLGGPVWRLRQKIGWRADAVLRRLFPEQSRAVELE